MKDTFGREIRTGDLVAIAGASASTPFMSVGEVVGPCKKGDGIRVRVLHSNSLAFRRGLRKYRPGDGYDHSGDVVRERGSPYVATFQRPERVLVIDWADVPFNPT